jgi:hypothetical protein
MQLHGLAHSNQANQMTFVRVMSILGFIATLFGSASMAPAQVPDTPASDDNPMVGLRTMMLTTPASKLGIKPDKEYPKVYGVLIDWPLGEHTATIVSMSDGNASLYTTSTFGILGGINHESVRNAATALVKAAQAYYEQGTPTKEYPYPPSDRIRFYLLGYEGVRVIDGEAAELENGAGKLINLWAACQNVVSELRQISEKAGSEQ